MKIWAILAMTVALENGARGDEVTVYMKGILAVPAKTLWRAQSLANEMFAAVGVKIAWRRGEPSRSESRRDRAIVVEMMTETPLQLKPGALAFARPYEGVHVNVFYDRVQAATEPELTPNVLAHVLAHEITHVLQGTCRHSDRGVMKARWNHEDYMEMRLKPLSFTEEDVQLIRAGLVRRATPGTLVAAARTR